MLEQLSLFDPAFCQRWRGGKHTWRPVHEGGFDRRRYRLMQMPEAPIRRFVEAHHYSRSFPASKMSFGLLERGHLVGAVVLGVPMHPAVLTKPFPTLGADRAAEISRLILLDVVPSNAESWLLGQLFRLAAGHGLRGLVAFSDPMPRILGGELLMPGHVGHIYRVTRGRYLGRGTARTITILPDGTVLPARAAQKVRAEERGAQGVRARLTALGARPLPETVTEYARAGYDLTPAEWLELALVQIGARRVRHCGCHRFAWPVGDRGWRRRCPIGLTELPYPLATDPAVIL
ncbi:hypothetical protein ACI2K4_29560 [Micromonospora sp. NPDC050397]|uniref:Mom family adenine methylcarbamoylation protein n=1 Tax=Micromonospora sp. NPDC050397 TaxID=3364279 RepID=UPI0038501D53